MESVGRLAELVELLGRSGTGVFVEQVTFPETGERRCLLAAAHIHVLGEGATIAEAVEEAIARDKS